VVPEIFVTAIGRGEFCCGNCSLFESPSPEKTNHCENDAEAHRVNNPRISHEAIKKKMAIVKATSVNHRLIRNTFCFGFWNVRRAVAGHNNRQMKR
jgi:hypothetical protein